MTTRPQTDDAIVLDIEIAAPPGRVFEALTDPRRLAEWWSMEQEPVSWELDPRVGGRWRAVGRDATCGEWVLSGEVLELDPPRVFACSWSEHSQSKQLEGTVVRFVLTPIPSGTRLRLTHSGFGDAVKPRDEYRSGWPGVCARLRRYLAPS